MDERFTSSSGWRGRPYRRVSWVGLWRRRCRKRGEPGRSGEFPLDHGLDAFPGACGCGLGGNVSSGRDFLDDVGDEFGEVHLREVELCEFVDREAAGVGLDGVAEVASELRAALLVENAGKAGVEADVLFGGFDAAEPRHLLLAGGAHVVAESLGLRERGALVRCAAALVLVPELAWQAETKPADEKLKVQPADSEYWAVAPQKENVGE